MLTPASLTVIISRPGQTRSAGTASNESLPERGGGNRGRRLRCPAWYPRIMAPTPARRQQTRGHARALYVLVVYGEDLGSGLSVRTRPRGVSSPSWVGLGLGNRQDGLVGVWRRPMQGRSGGSKPTEFLQVLGPDRLSRVQIQFCSVLLQVTVPLLPNGSEDLKRLP